MNEAGGGRDVVGETPNLAAQLRALAEPGTVSSATTPRQLLASLFELVDLGAHSLEGFPEPVRAWRVLHPNTAEGRFEAMHRSRSSTSTPERRPVPRRSDARHARDHEFGDETHPPATAILKAFVVDYVRGYGPTA